MRLGQGLTMITIGMILTFAVRADPDFINIHVVGLILILVGAAANHKIWERRREAALMPRPMDDTFDPELPSPPSVHHTTMEPTVTK